MATWVSPVESHSCAIHRPNRSANASGSSLANTRSNVSWLGTPWGSSRNRRKNASLLLPYSAISSHPSAPAITAQVAITRMSVSGCSLLAVWIRGSGRSANTVVSASGIGYPPDALGVVAKPYTVSGS
jgi:hypothetical protein